MASQLIENTFLNVYKDDFRDSDNYHRILFNGGRALQARELTQLQTILSKEIERFGRNIFKEGAAVNPIANVMIDNRYAFVKLESTDDITPSMIGVEYQGQTSNVKAKIIGYINAEGADPRTIYVQYTSGSSPSSALDTPFSTFTPGEQLVAGGYNTLIVQSINSSVNPATGYGTKASVGSGEFFVQGHFVYAEQQTIILSKYTSNPTATIGFRINESIVTALDDNKLYDNQGDVPNLTAPGADRYRIRLTLIDKADVTVDETFVFVANIVNGNVVQLNNGRGDYNRILDVMAERTYEESGNYAVTPFVSTFEADSDSTYLRLNVADGLGYVRGYRADPGQTYIRVQKPTSTTSFNNEGIPATYGNFVSIQRDTLRGLPDISTYELINLRDSVGYRGSNIGTARVRSVEDDSDYKFYLFDVKMSSGKNFRSVKSLGTDSSEYGNIRLEAGVAVLKEVNNNNLFFQLPRSRPSSISAADYTYTVQRYKTGTVSAGKVTITAGTGETWTSTNEWLVRLDSGGADPSATFTNSGSTADINVSTSYNGKVLQIIALAQKGSTGAPTPYKTKTLTETTVTGTVLTDSSGQYVALGKADIWEIKSIKLVDSNGADVSGRFYLDNGQRDNSYQLGKLRLTPGQTAPGGNVFSRFRYFSHSGNGDFFCVNSYPVGTGANQISYAEIPSYKQQDGTVIDLRDVLDFRPTINNAGTGYSGTGAIVSELPQNTDLITLDTTYYLPRKDKLVLEDTGVLKYVEGTPALDPQFPIVQDNAMELYQFTLNPNTLNEKDLKSKYIDNRRYTMRDIGKLHQKILKVEEMATLSLLDIQAATLEVLDADGLNRTKAGFLTDDFRDHRAAMVDNLEFRASIDPSAGVLRPAYREKNVALVFDSEDTDNLNSKLQGDDIMLDYSETLYFDQNQVSGTVNVNPYTLIDYQGTIILSPSTDEHRDVVNISLRVDGRDELTIESFLNQTLGSRDTRAILDTIRNNPDFGGRREFVRQRISLQQAQNFLSSGTLQQALTTLPPKTSQILASVFDVLQPTWREFLWGWAGIDGRQTDEELINGAVTVTNRQNFGRFASRLFIPRIRAREVRFRATGLLPNTRHWPFFDGVRIDEWCVQLENLPLAYRPTDFAVFDGRWRWGRRGRKWRNRFLRSWIQRWAWPGWTGHLHMRHHHWRWHPYWHFQAPLLGLGTIPSPWESRLISDQYGVIQGSFFIPNTDTLFFHAGTKRFSLYDITVEDDENSCSRAWADYVVEGVTQVRIRPIRPRVVNRKDPIAQTFTVDNAEGMFVTKIRAFFKTKPTDNDGAQIECEIRPVVNGYPSSLETVKDALKSLSPDEVNVSDDATLGTDFVFDVPIYLKGNTEYAVILRAPTTEYQAYVSRVGDFVLGTTDRKITKQPTLGSLFKSQNGATWEPSQWEDLMFQIYRADFVSSGTVVFVNDHYEHRLLVENPLLFTAGDSDVRVIHPNHGLVVGDIITLSGIDSAATYPITKINSLVGVKTITAVDGSGYKFVIDSAASSSVRTGGSGIYSAENVLMDEMYLSTEVETPPGTSVSILGKFTTAPNYLGDASGGYNAYDREASYSHSLAPFKPYTFESPRIILSEQLEYTNNDPTVYPVQSAEIKFSLSTASSWVSPILSADRASITAIQNIIDNQDSANTSGYNVPITWVAETNPTEGTALAKYVTKPVTLEEDAVGLKIIIAANKPTGTDYKVYYKLLTSNEQILEKSWVLIEPENLVQNDDNPTVFREQRYLVGGLFGTTPFNIFQVKIVMTSTNTSKVPKFKDFRAIALTV